MLCESNREALAVVPFVHIIYLAPDPLILLHVQPPFCSIINFKKDKENYLALFHPGTAQTQTYFASTWLPFNVLFNHILDPFTIIITSCDIKYTIHTSLPSFAFSLLPLSLSPTSPYTFSLRSPILSLSPLPFTPSPPPFGLSATASLSLAHACLILLKRQAYISLLYNTSCPRHEILHSGFPSLLCFLGPSVSLTQRHIHLSFTHLLTFSRPLPLPSTNIYTNTHTGTAFVHLSLHSLSRCSCLYYLFVALPLATCAVAQSGKQTQKNYI